MKMIQFGEFDRLFERMFHDGYSTPVWCEMTGCHEGPAAARPDNGLPVDVIHDSKSGLLKLVAEIPGVEKENIDVAIQDDRVNIRAIREETAYESSVPIRHAVRHDSVKASYKNGVLEVTFVVDDGPKGQRVRVE